MRPKIFSKKLFLASFVFFASLFALISPTFAVECAPGITPAVCPTGQACRPCDPPTLPQLETLAIQAIGLVYVFVGVVFFFLFVYNGYLYMFNKVEDAKKRMTQWIIGFIMILFAQPVIATFMRFIIGEGEECYEELRQPSFTFFFPQVCTEDNPTTPTPEP